GPVQGDGRRRIAGGVVAVRTITDEIGASVTSSDGGASAADAVLGRSTHTPCEVSVVMPCLNEADTVATCIAKAHRALRSLGIQGEVIVADNGSVDGSQEIGRTMGARVVGVPERGYGSALMGGI